MGTAWIMMAAAAGWECLMTNDCSPCSLLSRGWEKITTIVATEAKNDMPAAAVG